MLNDKKRVNLLCEKMLNYANNNRKKQYIYEKNQVIISDTGAVGSDWGDASYLDNCFVTIADSISTSIQEIIYDQTTHTHSDRQTVAPYIDLQGRRLQGLPPRKGLYIRKGRKVLIR